MSPVDLKGRAYHLADSPNRPVAPAARQTACLLKLMGEEDHEDFWRGQARTLSAPTVAALRAVYRDVDYAFEKEPELSRRTARKALTEELRSARVYEALLQSGHPDALGLALHRRLLAAYAEPSYREFEVASRIVEGDLRDSRVVNIAGWPDVPLADPEASDFTEVPVLVASPAATIVKKQYAVIISISRESALADDLGLVARVIAEAGRSGRRTVAKIIWGLFATNAPAPDGVAWFAAGHGANTSTTALTEAGVIAGLASLRGQTIAGTAEKLGGIVPGSVLLVVPDALAAEAHKLNQTTGSGLHWFFGPNNEQVHANPLLADATDWYLVRRVQDVENVRVAFHAREEPTITLASAPTVGQAFLADKIRYKISIELGAVVADFRGGYKAVVAG